MEYLESLQQIWTVQNPNECVAYIFRTLNFDNQCLQYMSESKCPTRKYIRCVSLHRVCRKRLIFAAACLSITESFTILCLLVQVIIHHWSFTNTNMSVPTTSTKTMHFNDESITNDPLRILLNVLLDVDNDTGCFACHGETTHIIVLYDNGEVVGDACCSDKTTMRRRFHYFPQLC